MTRISAIPRRARWLTACLAAVLVLAGCGKPEPAVTESVVDKMPLYMIDGVHPIWISPDWQSIAVSVTASEKAPMSINGQATGGGYLVMDSVTWLPDSSRCFYGLRVKGEEHVFSNQEDLGVFQDHRLVFTDDGKHWALWEGVPKPGQRILTNAGEKHVASVRDIRYVGPKAYYRNDFNWTAERGTVVDQALATQLDAQPDRPRVITPRGYLREASTAGGGSPNMRPAATSARPAEAELHLKVRKRVGAAFHQLWVNGKMIREYEQVLERRVPSEGRSEWHHVAADGTVTLYGIRMGKIYRITIRPGTAQ